jgi:hypothetical protein
VISLKFCRTSISLNRIDIIEFIQQQGAAIDDNQMTQLLNYAGARDKLAAAQWLRQQGVQWPTVLGYSEAVTHNWSRKLIKWARSEGCTSPTIV